MVKKQTADIKLLTQVDYAFVNFDPYIRRIITGVKINAEATIAMEIEVFMAIRPIIGPPMICPRASICP